MKIVDIDCNILLRRAKKKSDVVKDNSFVRILKPRSGAKSAGYIVQLLRCNKEFYCDNITEYAGYIFASTLDDKKISMIDPNQSEFEVRELDRLDVGPMFAIAVLSNDPYHNSIIRKDGTIVNVDKSAGFYGDFNNPESVRFKDQKGNLSTDFFVDIYGRVLAGATVQNRHIHLFGKLNTPGMMAYDVAGREFDPSDKEKLIEARTLDLFSMGRLKLDDILAADKNSLKDPSFAKAVERILLNKFEEMKKKAKDNNDVVRIEDSYYAALKNLKKVLAELDQQTVDF